MHTRRSPIRRVRAAPPCPSRTGRLNRDDIEPRRARRLRLVFCRGGLAAMMAPGCAAWSAPLAKSWGREVTTTHAKCALRPRAAVTSKVRIAFVRGCHHVLELTRGERPGLGAGGECGVGLHQRFRIQAPIPVIGDGGGDGLQSIAAASRNFKSGRAAAP